MKGVQRQKGRPFRGGAQKTDRPIRHQQRTGAIRVLHELVDRGIRAIGHLRTMAAADAVQHIDQREDGAANCRQGAAEREQKSRQLLPGQCPARIQFYVSYSWKNVSQWHRSNYALDWMVVQREISKLVRLATKA